jgi:hypothetical protein
MSYTLKLVIDETSLNLIEKAKQKIVLAKQVDAEVPDVAWIVFAPFQNNIVEWTDEFGLYASLVPSTPEGSLPNDTGITIVSSRYPAQCGQAYSFSQDASFHEISESCQKDSLLIDNQMSVSPDQILAFGLTQKATINTIPMVEPACLNISLVMYQFQAIFRPWNVVYVWFQNLSAPSILCKDVASKKARVPFDDACTAVSLKFDPLQGQFVAIHKEEKMG